MEIENLELSFTNLINIKILKTYLNNLSNLIRIPIFVCDIDGNVICKCEQNTSCHITDLDTEISYANKSRHPLFGKVSDPYHEIIQNNGTIMYKLPIYLLDKVIAVIFLINLPEESPHSDSLISIVENFTSLMNALIDTRYQVMILENHFISSHFEKLEYENKIYLLENIINSKNCELEDINKKFKL